MRRRAAKPKEEVVEIKSEYITLGQVLQVAGVVGSGGEAKYFLSEVPVQVNGEDEARRGRKLRPGDIITAPDIPRIRIAAGDATQATEEDDAEPEQSPEAVDSLPNVDAKSKGEERG